MKLKFTLILILFSLHTLNAQTVPSDFELVCTTGGNALWEISETNTISSNGESNFFRSRGGSSLEILADDDFTLSSSEVGSIWQSVQNNNIFSLESSYQEDSMGDGSFVYLTVTANGETKQVSVKNVKNQEVENLISDINSVVPSGYTLNYTPHEKIDIIAIDPCSQVSNIIQPQLEKDLNNKIAKTNYNGRYPANSDDPIQVPHGGFAIGYQYSLNDAVSTNRADLSSKGEFYGDGVSIKGNATVDFPPQDNTIHLKLYLEFYGPCDNSANEFKIINAILKKWDGLTTSDGKTFKMEIVSLSNPGVNSPPQTAGFNEIKIQCGKGKSVAALGTPNSDDVGNGTWYIESEEGTFAHEAGHLMGLDDQYTSYKKQLNKTTKDFEWINEQDLKTTYSNSEFVDLYQSKYPDFSIEEVQNFLNNHQRAGWAKEGHEHDLMSDDATQPVLQEDIDGLASLAGLIINISAGNVLSNPSNGKQNMLVIHSGDLVIDPGKTKTLNGIYAACIDKERIPPNYTSIFNVAPSLDLWNGISAADDLLKLVNYIDTTIQYCGNDLTPQYAIWRITDNYITSSEAVNTLLENSGVSPGNKIYYFPKLKNHSIYDTSSQVIVPYELFHPDIEPKITEAEIGEEINFSTTISKPTGLNYSTGFSWLLESPEGSSSEISTDGNLIPDKSGLYKIGLNLSITDSLNNVEEFTPELNAYAVIPDKFTETFEWPSLAYKFPWETYGDGSWELTNSDALTGSYSAKPGEISPDQSTTLAINVNLPKDTVITFAVKLLTNFGRLNFSIDSNITESWNTINDWKFYEFDLESGEHKLTWKYKKNYEGPSNVWIDNIFFPYNSVITDVITNDPVSFEFNLSQNYPNPFNPTTLIKYTIPLTIKNETSKVNLIVYDVLGRRVKTLVDKKQPAGNYEVTFDASKLSSGIYFYTLKTKGFVQTKKMILLR